MDKINNINWSWHTIRTGPDQLAYFDTTFDDHESDIFYCNVNEIDPALVGMPLTDDENGDDPIDPRTNINIENLVIDHTKQQKTEYKPNFFQKFLRKSTMNKNQHSACLRVLKAIIGNTSIDPSDMKTFSSTEPARKQENKLFSEFLQNYFTAHCNEIFKFTRKFFEISKMQFEKIVHSLLSKENSFYSLQTAMPLSGVNLQNITTTASHPKILYKTGYIPILERNIKFPDISEISSEFIEKIDYMPACNRIDDYLNEVILKQNLEEFINVIIPENTLVLLLDAFSNNKVGNWEIPINIDMFDDHRTIITFKEHLPKRNFDMNEFKEMYKQFYESQVLSTTKNWYCLDDDSFRECQKECYESDSREVNLDKEYTLYEFDDYLNRFGKYGENIMEPGFGIVKWKLCGEKEFNLLTKTKLQSFQKEASKILFNSIKLELKSECGAEVMTKSELIAEWLKVFLQVNSITERIRVCPATSEELGRTTLSLKAIEDEMLRLYNTQISTILSILHLKLIFLQNFPKGEYLLKHTSKHVGKIMIYKKTVQSVPNVINIHALYKDYKYSENLSEGQEILPIDMNFITPMHEFYQIVPCCFPHWGDPRSRRKIINDKAQIIKAKIMKEKAILEKKKELAKERKRQSRMIRRKKIRNTKEKETRLKLEEDTINMDLDALEATYPLYTSINDLAKTNTTSCNVSVEDNLKCVYDFNEYATDAGVLDQPLEVMTELKKMGSLLPIDLKTNKTLEPSVNLESEEIKKRKLTVPSKITLISNRNTKKVLAKGQPATSVIRKKNVKTTKARILTSLRTKKVFARTKSRT